MSDGDVRGGDQDQPHQPLHRRAHGRAQGMIARKRGKVINIASLASELARQTIGPYTAAKGGVRQLTKTMCVEWAEHNIQANAIGPGYFRTELNRALVDRPDVQRAGSTGAHARRPLGRPGGACRRGGVPCLRRVGLHERPDALRRRRPAGVDVTPLRPVHSEIGGLTVRVGGSGRCHREALPYWSPALLCAARSRLRRSPCLRSYAAAALRRAEDPPCTRYTFRSHRQPPLQPR